MNEIKMSQQILIKDGRILSINGVNSILSLDESFLKLNTTMGVLCVEGKNLIVENLLKDKKEISVTGDIYLVEIKSAKKKK